MPAHAALTDEQRAQRRAQERDLAQQAVERLRSSEGWQSWLATRRHFHAYSLINQCLIAAAKPDATKVAGFKAWLRLGYCVRRGEHAQIRVWAPMSPTKKQLERWRAAGADPDQKPRLHFKLTPVWDRSQVEPLPAPSTPAVLDPPIATIEGDSLAPTLPRLVAFAATIGSTVAFEAMSGHRHGYYEPATRRIAIREDLSPNAQVKTLLHELAHALVRHHATQPQQPQLTYAEEELVAETVALCSIATTGIQTSGYSIPYLCSWSEDTPIATIQRTAALIDELAKRLEDALNDTPAAAGDSAPDDDAELVPAAA